MQNKLKVSVNSFSYKRGIPVDKSGNGGGFVFDCRSIHNPGKYDEYKKLTGKDKEVISFLEKDGMITIFLNDVISIVSKSVDVYIQRDFTDLMVSFGCTGGRHRSVYCAEHLALFLRNKYSIEVELTHQEQASW